MEWVEDVGGKWDIEDVLALAPKRFTRGDALSAGYTRSVYWVRLVDLPAMQGQTRWLEFRPPFLDQLDIYEVDGRRWTVQRLGDTRSRQGRLIDYRHIVIPQRSSVETDQTTIYARVQTTSATLLTVRWWTPEAFAVNATREVAQWGVYFGVALLSTLLALGLALLVRSRKLWALCLLPVAYVLVASNQGFVGWLLLPNSPTIVHMLPGFSVLLGQAATLWLIKETLDFREHLPRLDRVFTVLVCLMVISTISVPLDFYTELSVPSLLVIEASKWVAVAWGVVLWRRHGRMYGAITAAFAFHTLSILLTALTLSGVLPFHIWMLQAWQYGLVVLMLAIAGISLIQVRQDHLRRLGEKTEALLATEGARALLARKVADRTRELELTRDQLAQSFQDEQEAHFQQRQLVGLVSHEFRTPLAVIDLVLNNLELVPPETLEEVQQRLSQIRDANRHLVQLTDTCLADARLGAGLLKLVRPEALDLRDLLNSTLDMLHGHKDAPLGASARPRLETDGSGPAPTVWGDAGLLRIAFCNVLENARKYASGEPVRLRLAVGSVDPERVTLQVQDKGPGIAREDHERVFERFARGINVGTARGNGLGLYVSREIMRAHIGELRLLSENTKSPGCVFEFDWPLHQPTPHVHED